MLRFTSLFVVFATLSSQSVRSLISAQETSVIQLNENDYVNDYSDVDFINLNDDNHNTVDDDEIFNFGDFPQMDSVEDYPLDDGFDNIFTMSNQAGDEYRINGADDENQSLDEIIYDGSNSLDETAFPSSLNSQDEFESSNGVDAELTNSIRFDEPASTDSLDQIDTDAQANSDNAVEVLSGNQKVIEEDDSIDSEIDNSINEPQYLSSRAGIDSNDEIQSKTTAPSATESSQSISKKIFETSPVIFAIGIIVPLMMATAAVALFFRYRREQNKKALARLLEKTSALDSIYNPSAAKTETNTPTNSSSSNDDYLGEWTRCFDEAGRSYWVNTNTGVSQWAKPHQLEITISH